MSDPIVITRSVAVTLDVETLAEGFAAMNDDQQAQFFVAVARRFAAFSGAGGDWQAYLIGGHLRNCECSTEGARELIRAIADGIATSQHGARGAA